MKQKLTVIKNISLRKNRNSPKKKIQPFTEKRVAKIIILYIVSAHIVLCLYRTKCYLYSARFVAQLINYSKTVSLSDFSQETKYRIQIISDLCTNYITYTYI